MKKSFYINKFQIKNKSKTFIIAEVAQAHEGSLGLAFAFIDAAANAGADAVKFQCHIAREESTLDEEFRIKQSPQDKTRYEYWERMEFKKNEWELIIKRAKLKGLAFICSIFSIKAIEMLLPFGIDAWKIGSGEFWSDELIENLLKTKIPILASTGMASWSDIDKLNDRLKKSNSDYMILHCCSKYPTPLNDIGLNIINEMMKKYSCPIGYSDHSAVPIVPKLAIMMGISALEVHVTFSRDLYGPDSTSSLTFEELKILCEEKNIISNLLNSIVSKDKISEELSKTKELFSKSAALREDKMKGEIVHEADITFKKPGKGINKKDLNLILGKKLKKNKPYNRILSLDDFL